MRYRKRIRIMKGLTLNLSKSGVSMTAGVPGMSVNTGRRGTYLNTGIPGTGLYDRTRIGGSPASRPRRPSRRGGHGTWNGHEERAYELSIDLSLDESGAPVVKDTSGAVVDDPGLLRKIRRSPEYKQKLRELSRRTHARYEQQTEAFIEIHTLTPEVLPESHWRDALAHVAPASWHARVFHEKPPEHARIQEELAAEAKREVRSLAFWRVPRLRREYVQAQLPKRLAEAEAVYLKAKRDFEADEAERRSAWNEAERIRCDAERTTLEHALAGETDYVESAFESRVADMELPVEFSIDFDYEARSGLLRLDIDLPEIEDLPQKKTTILKRGNVSIKDKSKRDLHEQYAHCVTGMLFFFAGEAFNVSPKIETIVASGYTQRVDGKTGHEVDDYVASVRFERSFFAKLNTQAIEPTEAIRGFEHRYEPYADGRLKAVEPL